MCRLKNIAVVKAGKRKTMRIGANVACKTAGFAAGTGDDFSVGDAAVEERALSAGKPDEAAEAAGSFFD